MVTLNNLQLKNNNSCNKNIELFYLYFLKLLFEYLLNLYIVILIKEKREA
jgi:hypothetical protein